MGGIRHVHELHIRHHSRHHDQQKGHPVKKMWRTIFVITIAIPQFVSLMLVSKMLTDTGVVNVLLQSWAGSASRSPS